MRALSKPSVTDAGKIRSVQDLINLGEEFLAAHDVQVISRIGYRARLKQFFIWVVANKIQKPTRQDIIAFKRHLVSSKFSACTVGGYLTAVRRFFAWLEAEGIFYDIAKTVRGPGKGRGHKRDALSVKQAVVLLNSLSQSSLIEMRDQCMIQVLLRRGLRSIELSRLSVGSIRQQGDEPVLWVHGKGRADADEFICLGSELYTLIMKYLSMRGSPKLDEPLFATLSTNYNGNRMSTRSIRRIVKQKLHSIGILNPRVTCHSLRATAVTCSLIGGASIQETASLVRHADINSTIGYARNIEKLKMIPELAIDGLLAKEKASA